MEISYETNSAGEPVKVTRYDNGAVVREIDIPLPTPAVFLTLTADKTAAAINEVITITAALSAPLDATFAVPVEDASGAVVKIKAVAFVGGAATVQLTFDKSGYYRLTEAGINRKLPADQKIGLAEVFEVTVYE